MAADAAAALQQLGHVVLVDELLQDRLARSGVTSAASLITTWRTFHTLAFTDAVPAVPMLPVHTPVTRYHWIDVQEGLVQVIPELPVCCKRSTY